VASLAIVNEHDYPEPVSNNWSQALQDVPAGKTIVLRAYVRTEGAEAANVCVQCWDRTSKRMLAYGSTPVFRGDQDWTRAKTQPVVVPPETASVVVRAALTGKGGAWFDDVSVEVVESPDTPEKGQPSQQPPAGRGAVSDLAAVAGGEILRSLPVTKDAMVLSYMEDWAHGNLDNIGIGNNGVRLLVEWAQPEGDLKDSRFLLALYARAAQSPPESAGPAPKIRILAIQKEWEELSSWKTQPPTPEEPVAEAAFEGGEGWKVFDVTPLVRAGARGAVLRFEREDQPPSEHCDYQFVSREGDAIRRPVLLVVKAKK